MKRGSMQDILQRLVTITKIEDITDFLEDLKEEIDLLWRPVGDRKNNLATINIGSFPASGLVERITNAIDTVIERKWEERGQPDISSPRQAATELFSIPNGSLRNIKNARDKALAEISKNVCVTIWDSGNDSRPTVDIRDFGKGLLSKEFPDSIMSLNNSNKIGKKFLSGAFGQGGSTALPYSLYTIICSRSVKSEERSSVAVTLVRYNPGDINVDKHGLYEYLVDPQTNLPFTVEIKDFPVGTLVRHASMDLGKFNKIMTAPTSSIWYLAHHYIFDPVLPFTIESKRSRDQSILHSRRSIFGNARRLDNNQKYKREARITFSNGYLDVFWWVLNFDDEKEGNIRNYIFASKPVIITYNGQKQGELSNSIIKDELKLPYLDKFIVVQVDCDGLDAEDKRHLFATTREQLKETSILDKLKGAVVQILKSDENLQHFDNLRREKFMSQSNNDSLDGLRKKLEKRLKNNFSSKPIQKITKTASKSLDPIVPQYPPTLLKMLEEETKTVRSGQMFQISFKTDIDASLFTSVDSFFPKVEPSGFAQHTGGINLDGGYGKVFFKANDNLTEDSKGKLSLEIKLPTGQVLRDSIKINVVLPEEPMPKEEKQTVSFINPSWIDKSNPFFKEKKWNEASVATILSTEDSVDIFVSMENKNINKIITRAQRYGPSKVESMKDFYLEHICYHSLLISKRKQNTSEDLSSNELSEELINEELQRVSETICGIMETQF